MKNLVVWLAGGVVIAAFVPVLAQTPATAAAGPSSDVQARDRYQIGLMEGILQRAAEHGAKVTRDRAIEVIGGDMLLSDEVAVRGFRLDGYGVFFDIHMPDLEGTLPWIFRTLDQNDLGLDSALRALTTLVESNGSPNDRQALQRVQLQLAPRRPTFSGGATTAGGARPAAPPAAGSVAATVADRTQAAPVDPIVSDPQRVYREEVAEALIEAMLDHSSGLRLEPTDWFTVAARGKESPSRLSPADTESPTIQITVRGEDLIALLGRQITREEARKRVVIKVF